MTTATVRVRVMPLRTTASAHDSFDVDELASEATAAIEAYRRAPWQQQTERTRLAKLGRAIELLKRIEDLEAGRIPMRMWGD